jgi:hypothetical protein
MQELHGPSETARALITVSGISLIEELQELHGPGETARALITVSGINLIV